MADEIPYIQPPDPNIGRRVDTYFVLRKLLGAGGMGAAYLAEHEHNPLLKCVIKLVLPSLAHHPVVVNRWEMEAQALSLLTHDNIVKLQGFGKLDDHQLFMRFELINGLSLSKHVADQGGRISLRDAAYLFFQVCDALDYAHALGVVHRDLKPDNLMIELDPRGSHLSVRVKILDFGLAKDVSTNHGQTGVGLALGTPGFMAPEQARNAAEANDKADVFSVAIVFYFMTTGEIPWGWPESDVDGYDKQKTQAPRTPPDWLMPAAVTKVIFRALSLRPDDRPTMREFALLMAAAIREEGRLPSGTEIFREVVRDWRNWSLSVPHTRTLPRPVADPAGSPPDLPTAERPDGVARVEGTPQEFPATGHGGSVDPESTMKALAPSRVDTSVEAASKKKRRSQNDMEITARGRPRAIAASLAAANAAKFQPAPPPFPSTSSTTDRPMDPLFAKLPVGIASQFDADAIPDGVRQPSRVAASEFLAIGTPSPMTSSADDLPAVLVSNTLMERTEKSAPPLYGVPGIAGAHPEAAPILVLPDAVKPSRHRAIAAAGAAVCVLAGVISFALVHRTQSSADEGRDQAVDHGDPEIQAAGNAPARATSDGSPSDGSPSDGMAERVRPADRAESSDLTHASSVGAADAAPPKHTSTDHPDRESSTPSSKDAKAAAPTANDSVGAVAPDNAAGRSITAQVVPAAVNVPPARISTATTPVPAKPAAPSPSRGAVTSSSSAARADARPGTLKVLVQPWALVYLDGRPMDQTPVVEDRVSPGRHRVRLVNAPAQKDETVTITVASGQVTTIERTW